MTLLLSLVVFIFLTAFTSSCIAPEGNKTTAQVLVRSRITYGLVYLADPASGLLKLSKEEFMENGAMRTRRNCAFARTE
jgi:hypothetical protein